MKSTGTLKITLSSAIVIVVASLYFLKPATQNCVADSSDNSQTCTHLNNQGWYSWIKGQSRSTQFHFVDLLELINRASPARK